jgi:hypothetical protein
LIGASWLNNYQQLKQTIASPVSSASFCNSVFQSCTRAPFEPPQSAVIVKWLARPFSVQARGYRRTGRRTIAPASNRPALERQAGDHAMTSDSIYATGLQPDAGAEERLFDNWFDSIESAVRDRDLAQGEGRLGRLERPLAR